MKTLNLNIEKTTTGFAVISQAFNNGSALCSLNKGSVITTVSSLQQASEIRDKLISAHNNSVSDRTAIIG